MESHGNVVVFANPEVVAEAAREHVLEVLTGAGSSRPAHVVLAGGSTPERCYALLAGVHPGVWEDVHFWFGDERTVPPDHDDSNFLMATRTLLSEIGAPDGRIHRMRGEDDPHEAARAYEDEIREIVPSSPSALPAFDLILLGMGDDGHTASLFPGTDALHNSSRLVVANEVPQQRTTRITLTYPALNSARHVLGLVTGGGKAEALAAVVAGGRHAPPAAGVKPTNGELRWLVDRAAAGKLNLS